MAVELELAAVVTDKDKVAFDCIDSKKEAAVARMIAALDCTVDMLERMLAFVEQLFVVDIVLLVVVDIDSLAA